MIPPSPGAGFANLLLDRDGTVIHDRHYLADPAGVALLPGVGEALALLARSGVRFFLVSNQSGIGRGLFPAKAVLACNARLDELLIPYGVAFSGSVFCPHTPEDACACRKPGIGLWHELQRVFSLTPENSAMVGDKTADLAFAANAGLAARVLTLTGKGADTAAKLGLPLAPCTENGLWLNPAATGAVQPQAVIRDFSFLPGALALLHDKRALESPSVSVRSNTSGGARS